MSYESVEECYGELVAMRTCAVQRGDQARYWKAESIALALDMDKLRDVNNAVLMKTGRSAVQYEHQLLVEREKNATLRKVLERVYAEGQAMRTELTLLQKTVLDRRYIVSSSDPR